MLSFGSRASPQWQSCHSAISRFADQKSTSATISKRLHLHCYPGHVDIRTLNPAAFLQWLLQAEASQRPAAISATSCFHRRQDPTYLPVAGEIIFFSMPCTTPMILLSPIRQSSALREHQRDREREERRGTQKRTFPGSGNPGKHPIRNDLKPNLKPVRGLKRTPSNPLPQQ